MTDAAETPQEETPEAPAAPNAEDKIAALEQKVKSYEGRDRAFAKTQAELAQEKADKEAALARLAEIEQTNMSELEKAQKERDKATAAAEKAEARALAAELKAEFPLAVAELDGEPLPSRETLARLEAKLAVKPTEPEPEPVIDVNRPAKAPLASSGPPSIEELTKRAREAVAAERANRPEFNH